MAKLFFALDGSFRGIHLNHLAVHIFYKVFYICVIFHSKRILLDFKNPSPWNSQSFMAPVVS